MARAKGVCTREKAVCYLTSSGALRVAGKQMAVKDALARSVCDRNQFDDRWYDTVIDVDYPVH
tara:strand:- start:89 stop:277 length:189 start_codon:yes stop_codon:yes gene_type:complete